ncbi:MAG TPA: hypothetical protein VG265_16600 [Gaiellaceae bacterium]|jgi:hypothetical protein|nr:hypothetical protein [Gaiellaceae bacterium]
MTGSTVTVHGPPERVADFIRVYGSTTVPVRERWALPHRAELPGVGTQDVYLLDASRITADQRRRLIALGVERFGMSEQEAEYELDTHGLPILAADTTFASTGMDFL